MAKEFMQVSAVLRVSIAVSREGDDVAELKPMQHRIQDEEPSLRYPPSIRMEYRQLTMSIIKVHKVQVAQLRVELNVCGKTYQSAVVQRDQDSDVVDVNMTFEMPVEWPPSKQNLTIKFYDEPQGLLQTVGLNKGALYGTCSFAIKKLEDFRILVKDGKIKDGQKGEVRWLNILGAPSTAAGTEAALMNRVPQEASAWKGRCLTHFKFEECEAPQIDTYRFQEFAGYQNIQESETYKKQTELKSYAFRYQIMAEVGFGVLLKGQQKYRVKIQIGDFDKIITEQPKQHKNEYCRWDERFETKEFSSCHASLNRVEFVFIYLIDEQGRPVAFWKDLAKNFKQPNAQFRWVHLKADKSIGVITDDFDAGMVQLKLSIIQVDGTKKAIDFNQYNAWNEKSKRKPRCENSCKVRAFIFQARDIPGVDDDGQSDCQIKIWNQMGQKVMTEVVEDTCHPIFYCARDFNIDFHDVESAPPIIFTFYDANKGMLQKDYNEDNNVYLGRTMISLAKCNANGGDNREGSVFNPTHPNEFPKPQWYPIYYNNDQTGQKIGEVLCSFNIGPADLKFAQPDRQLRLGTVIPQELHKFDLHVFGLRDLKSMGVMPVVKPFIEFNLRSMVQSGTQLMQNVIPTDPKAGSNPNYNSHLSFQMKLPIDQTYCPHLQCVVKDNPFWGFSPTTLGSFSIPAGEIAIQVREEIEKQIKRMNEVCTDLDELLGKGNAKQVLAELQRLKTIKRKESLEKRLRKSGITNEDLKAFKEMRLNTSMMEESKDSIVPHDYARNNSKFKVPQRSKLNGYHRMNDEESQIEMAMTNEPQKFLNTAFQSRISRLSNPEGLESQVKQRAKLEIQKKVLVHRLKSASGQDASEVQKQLQQTEKEIENCEQQIKLFKTLTTLADEENNGCLDEEIVWPVYKFDKTFSIYFEPKLRQLDYRYKQVGFNSQKEMQLIASGAEEQRDKIKRQQSNLHGGNVSIELSNIDRQSTIFGKRQTLLKSGMLDKPVEEPEKFRQVLRKENQKERAEQYSQMHYRRYYEMELEKVESLFPKDSSTFNVYEVKRLAKRGSNGFFSFGGATDTTLPELQTVGKFKGLISIKQDKNDLIVKRREIQLKIFGKLLQLYQKLNSGVNLRFTAQAASLVKPGSPDASLILNSHVDQFGSNVPKEKDFEFADLKDKSKRSFFLREMQQLNLDYVQELDLLLKERIPIEETQFELLEQKSCMVHLYILNGQNFASRDIVGQSDPYLVIKFGKKEDNERENYLDDEENPVFNKLYKYQATFPGTPVLEITAYDYDGLFGDDEIGHTRIDLDDRFYSQEWQKLTHKPIERRELMHESSALKQGDLFLWVDIFDEKQLENNLAGGQKRKDKGYEQGKDWPIQQEQKQKYQVRLAVYETEGVPNMDVEGASDVYISAFLQKDQYQETDTHYRCFDGKAEFNYRLLFDFELPKPAHVDPASEEAKTVLTIQLYDRDFFSANDYIGEYQIDLSDIAKLVQLSGRAITICGSLKEEVWPTPSDLSDQVKNFWWFNKAKNEKEEKAKQTTELEDGQFASAEFSEDIKRIFDPEQNGGITYEFPDPKDKANPTPDSFWISKTFENKGTDQKKNPQVTIKIRLDLRVVNQEYAELKPVGGARSEPNIDPYLTNPTTRLQFSLNPLKMLGQMLPPELWAKFRRYVCCGIILALCLVMSFLVLENVLTQLVMKVFSFGLL